MLTVKVIDATDAKLNKWPLVLLCYAAMMALSIGVNLLPVFLTTISMHFGGGAGLTNEALGSIGTSLFAGLVAGIAMASPLADRFGEKFFAVSGNFLTALSLIACGLANSYSMLVLSCFFVGFAAGILDIVLSPIVSALEPDKRSMAMNLLHSFYCIGAVVTIFLATVVIGSGFDLSHACFMFAPFPIVVGLLMAIVKFPDPGRDATIRIHLKDLVRKRWFLFALLAIALGGATEVGMAHWLPTYAETVLECDRYTAGLGLLFFSMAMALGRIAVGFLANRFSATSLMLGSCFLSVVCFLIASFSPFSHLAFASSILAGFAGSALWPTTLAVVADRYPAGSATMYGALAAFGNAGGILMPWLVGYIADLSNLRFGLATSTLAPLGMFFMILMMRSQDMRVYTEPTQ